MNLPVKQLCYFETLHYPWISVLSLVFSTFQTDRFVEVDFNSLDTTVNLQTWVVFLEFFGIGKAPEEMVTSQQQETVNVEDHGNGNDETIKIL